MKLSDVEDMVRAIIEQADYDLSKQLNPDLAEEPEFAEEFMEELVSVALEWIDLDD